MTISRRPWDPEERYAHGQLKEYKYWALEVSYRQHTFGNYIIFSKENVERLSELSKESLLELPMIMREAEEALSENKVFQPDRFNYWQMGNQLHQLHFHGIPRYKAPRNFAGKEWIDTTWGHSPVWSKETIEDELVAKLRDEIRKKLQ